MTKHYSNSKRTRKVLFAGLRSRQMILKALSINLFIMVLLTGFQSSAYTITGTVFIASRGLPLKINGSINGTPASTIAAQPLYVYIINQHDSIIKRTQVASNGTYRIDSIPAGLASAVQLSLNYYPIYGNVFFIGLPSKYIAVGEGDVDLGDNTPDYSFPLAQAADIEVNFGFETRPSSINAVISNYAYANSRLKVPAQCFNGTDPEDGSYDNNLAGRSVDMYISVPAATTKLYYYDTLLDFSASPSNIRINDFNPTKVSIGITGAPTIRSFSYTVADEAGARAYVPTTITTSTPLYVNLASLSGTWQQGAAVINWSTASEQNNDYFVIERSLNGSDFTNIDKVLSKAKNGTSTAALAYQYTDNSLAGLKLQGAYYRLRIVDKSGVISNTRVLHISSGTGNSNGSKGWSVYPNPAAGSITYSAGSELQEAVQVNLINPTGAILISKSIEGKNATQGNSFDLTGIPNGMYFLQANDKNGILTSLPVTVKH